MLFKGAGRAVVTDTEGKEYPVSSIIGVDELYDVVRFKVSVPRKVPYLTLTSNPVANGAQVYQLGYSSDKNAVFSQGEIVEVSSCE